MCTKLFLAVVGVSLSITLAGCPPIPMDKDERLEGHWGDIVYLLTLPWETYPIEGLVTFSKGVFTLEIPGEDPVSGEYFVDSGFDAASELTVFDWHTPQGIVRGYYEFRLDDDYEIQYLFFILAEPRAPCPWLNTAVSRNFLIAFEGERVGE